MIFIPFVAVIVYLVLWMFGIDPIGDMWREKQARLEAERTPPNDDPESMEYIIWDLQQADE